MIKFLSIIILIFTSITSSQADTSTANSRYIALTYQGSGWQSSAEQSCISAASFVGTITFKEIQIYNGTKQCYNTNNAYYTDIYQESTCPTGSTKTGTVCTYDDSCTSPQIRQNDGSCSVPQKDCTSTSHTVFSENSAVDTGAQSVTQASQLKGCQDGCEVAATDYRPNAVQSGEFYTATIAGVPHYFVGGVVSYTGASCTTGKAPITTKPTDTCASGDIAIKVAGKSACVTPPSTVKSIAPTISQTPAGVEPKTLQTTTNPVDPSAPSVTTVTNITHDSSGAVSNVTSTSINTVNNSYGQNPSEAQSTDLSAVTSKLDAINNNLKVTGTTSGSPKGNNSANNNFYVSKYPDGLTSVMGTAKSNLANTSMGKLTNDLSPNLGDSGSAPAWTMNFNMGPHMNFGTWTLGTDSNLWNILSIIFIISSLFVARSLIFGG